MKFTIDRTKWLRGSEESVLRRELDGKMCCIGFCCLKCGANEMQMVGVQTVFSLIRAGATLQSPMVDEQQRDPNWLAKAYAINDEPKISDEEREQKLQQLFATRGHEIEFVN